MLGVPKSLGIVKFQGIFPTVCFLHALYADEMKVTRVMAFQALAIEGSKQYYAYLEQCGKGVVSIDVLKVSCVEDSALFDLTLGQIPFNPDGLQVKICHDTFEYNDSRRAACRGACRW